MNLKNGQAIVEAQLEPGDKLVGFFQAMAIPRMRYVIPLSPLLGPLVVFGIRFYYVAVTERGVAFHRLNLTETCVGRDFFPYGEIKDLRIGKGLLQRPMKFHFANGRRVKIRAQIRGARGVAKLTLGMQTVLEGAIRGGK